MALWRIDCNKVALGMLAIVLSDSAVNMDIDIFRQSVSVSLYVHVCVPACIYVHCLHAGVYGPHMPFAGWQVCGWHSSLQVSVCLPFSVHQCLDLI